MIGVSGVVQTAQGPNLTFVSSISTSGAKTVFGFGSVSIGTATSDRYVLLQLGLGANTALMSLTSVTVNGTAAAQVVLANTGGASFNRISAIYGILVPNGTTASVTATITGTSAGCVIGSYILTSWNSTSAISTATVTTTTAGVSSLTTSISNVDGGVVMGVSGNFINSTASWTGLTLDYQAVATGSTIFTSTGASLGPQAASAARQITSTFNGTNDKLAMALASFK